MAETVNTDAPAYIVDGVLTDGEAWVPLVTNVLTSDAQPITFQSSTGANDWSQYMDLVVVVYARSVNVSTDREMNMQLNNDAGSNYTTQKLRGYGTGLNSSAGTAVRFVVGQNPAASAAANIFGVTITTLFDINSGKYKSGLSQTTCNLNGSGAVELMGLTWKSQAPITEIDLFGQSGSDFLAGSRFDLFGVLPRMVTA